jgi:uncharacterized membrane protein
MTRTGRPSTAAVAGHPIHPILVTLPIGSAVLTFLSDLLAARSGLTADAHRSRWLLGITVLTGLMAVPSGMIDGLTIPAARRSLATWLHAGGNAAMLSIGLLEWTRRRGTTPLTASQVWPSVSAIMVGILTVTGWLGGELAYRKGIAVAIEDDLPEAAPDEEEPVVTGPSLSGGEESAAERTDITPT